MSRIILFSILVFHTSMGHCQKAPASLFAKGVVVQFLTPHGIAENADIRVGDVLVRWTQGNISGVFVNPFEFDYVKREQGARASVRIDGFRGNQHKSWILAPRGWDWGIQTRPNFSGPILAVCQQAEKLERSNKIDEAIATWKSASDSSRNFETPWLPAWLSLHTALLSVRSGQANEFDDLFQKAVRLLPEGDAIARANVFTEWALALQRRSEPAAAAIHFQQALQEWRKVGSETMVVSETLFSLGSVAFAQDDIEKAEEYIKQALPIAQKLAPGTFRLAHNLGALGDASRYRGNLALAEAYYRRDLAIEEQIFPHDKISASLLESLGIIAYLWGNLPEAESRFRRALELDEKKDANGSQIAWLLSELAQCALERGDTTSADRYAQRAVILSERNSPGSPGVAESYMLRGMVASARNNYTDAEQYFQKAMAVAEKSGAQMQITRITSSLGDLELKRGDLMKAEQYFRAAVEITAARPEENDDHEESLASLAGVLRKEQKLEASAQVYEQLLTILENQTNHAGTSSDARSGFRARHARFYTEYSDLLVSQRNYDHAFEVLERSRAQTLIEMLAAARVDLHTGVDSGLITKQRDLEEELSTKSNLRLQLLHSKDSDKAVKALDDQIAEVLARLRDTKEQIRENMPSYAALLQPRPLSTAEIQQLLDPDTILLEYALGNDRSYLWMVTQDSITPYPLPGRSVIESSARQLYALLTARNVSRWNNSVQQTEESWQQKEQKYRQAALNLSQMILGPVATKLGRHRLLIVSDGALQYIPFAALPSPSNVDTYGGAVPTSVTAPAGPLLLQHEIVNLASASLLMELRRERQQRQKPSMEIAMFADPVFSRDDVRVSPNRAGKNMNHARSSQNSRLRADSDSTLASSLTLTRSASDTGLSGFYLQRLPFTRLEATEILASMPADKSLKALDFDASKMKVLDPSLSHYRVVHFATHGILDSEHPELSGLIMSLVDKQGTPQNGFLQLEDIYNLNLPVDLVVLSGCETGLGREMDGEGMIGLTRGFMYAGARKVVASLWSVSDEATAELMAKFYEAMEKDSLSPAAALRAAQIELWHTKRWNSPYYWAAFQLHGDWK